MTAHPPRSSRGTWGDLDPLTRLAFQRALARVTSTPGSMVYGNTTIYGAGEVENYANLASYLLVDIIGQRAEPTGHGLNPVPVTEALRIPEIDEIVSFIADIVPVGTIVDIVA